MSGRETPRHSDDPDDWFGPVGDDPPRPPGGTALEAPARAGEASVTEDDWLDPAPADRLDAVETGLTVRLGTLLVAAAILLALVLVAGLAVGGVFSGGGTKGGTGTTAPPTVTTTQTPSTTPTTTPASAAVPAPATTLKPGDTGAQVKRLQRALKHLGYSVGAVDADYGSSTQAAVKRFQQTAKLTADGVLGPKSLQALKRALLAHG
jgi:hypothetical protein